MHEMSIAQNIVEVVKQHMPLDDKRRIKSVKLKLGAFADIERDSLEYCFEVITEGTALQGATLDIEEIEMTAKCRGCGATSQLTYGAFVCPVCTSSDIDVLTGAEFEVIGVHLSEERNRPSRAS
jgi:hydrogenase nickel incorporation protein HypA/HybF